MFLQFLFSQNKKKYNNNNSLDTIDLTTIYTIWSTSNVLSHALLYAGHETSQVHSTGDPPFSWFTMELPSVFHPYLLHSPPVVYLWYSNYMAGSHWGVRCLSIVTHVTVNNSPLRDRARMHVGIQGHLSIGGHGPRRDWIITSITLMIDKTGIFPIAQTQSPPHLCHLSGHQRTQCLCMQSTHDLGWLTHHIIQETQKRLMLVRE